MNDWKNVRCIESSDSNVRKFVFTKDTGVAEAVLYKYPTYEERTVICCSTQSGCPIGCRFCGAGDSFVRSLSADEIVSQTETLLAHQNIDSTQIERMQVMFMSMGEPLLNLAALVPAIHRLNELYPQAALLVSTSAPRVDYGPMVEVSRAVAKVGLQFSVHESTDERRNALIPFKAKLNLAEIAEQGVRWHDATGRKPFFNYCAHPDNVGTEDADRIYTLFDPAVWEATISVICERDESIAAANERQRELAARFQMLLMERGFGTRMFDPAGQDDIGGGCGQLWFVQDWMRNNPHLARPSIGRNKPSVHTPGVENCNRVRS